MAALIFLLLLALFASVFTKKKTLPLVLFFISAVAILLLFLHHGTSKLPISL